jgi:hypothetical protein
MLRQTLCCFLILVLAGLNTPVLAAERSPASASGLRRQLLSIPAGKNIEVKLKQEGSKKVTGELGPVTNDGFEIQTVKSGVVSSEKIAFADVESVKKRGMRLAFKVLIVVAAALAVGAVVIERISD